MVNTIRIIGVMVILLSVWLPSMAQDKSDREEALEYKVEQLEAQVEKLTAYNDEIKEEELEAQLEELKSVDKEDLTKEEKKEWKQEKRAVKRELYDLREDEYDPWDSRNLYNARFSPFWGYYGYGLGYSPFMYNRRFFAPRRVIIVRPTRSVSS